MRQFIDVPQVFKRATSRGQRPVYQPRSVPLFILNHTCYTNETLLALFSLKIAGRITPPRSSVFASDVVSYFVVGVIKKTVRFYFICL